MKDEETLAQHKLSDGFVVHLVVKSAAAASRSSQQGQSSSTTGSASTPATAPATGGGGGNFAPGGNNGGSNPFAAFGFPDILGGAAGAGGGLGMGGMGAGLGQMQQELMQNPEMMRQLMDSPFVQGMYVKFKGILSFQLTVFLACLPQES